MSYSHRYALENVSCPRCNADLTAERTVRVYATNNLSEALPYTLSNLSSDGELCEDAAGYLAAGFHSGTECRACGEALDNYEG